MKHLVGVGKEIRKIYSVLGFLLKHLCQSFGCHLIISYEVRGFYIDYFFDGYVSKSQKVFFYKTNKNCGKFNLDKRA